MQYNNHKALYVFFFVNIFLVLLAVLLTIAVLINRLHDILQTCQSNEFLALL